MTYTILIYETRDELGARTDAKRKDAYWGACPAASSGAVEVRPNLVM